MSHRHTPSELHLKALENLGALQNKTNNSIEAEAGESMEAGGSMIVKPKLIVLQIFADAKRAGSNPAIPKRPQGARFSI